MEQQVRRTIRRRLSRRRPAWMAMVAHSGFTPARIEEIRIQLLDPFDPAEIKWRVTATSTQQSRNGPVKRGQLVAYADQRAYTDRLNEIFGEWGWTRTYNVQVAQNFERTLNKGANGQKQSVICAKVVVVSTVSVNRPWVAHRRWRGMGGRREFGDAGGSPGIQARLRLFRTGPLPVRSRQSLGGLGPIQPSGARVPTCRTGRFPPTRGGRRSRNPVRIRRVQRNRVKDLFSRRRWPRLSSCAKPLASVSRSSRCRSTAE